MLAKPSCAGDFGPRRRGSEILAKLGSDRSKPPGGPEMVTFAEEILLLSHDETRDRFLDINELLINTALAGAVLMDLAMRDRIDTDLEHLIVIDATPTGEPLLDCVLADLADAGTTPSTAAWLETLRHRGPELYNAALDRLIERGILRIQNSRVLWAFETRRYPLIDAQEQQEVKLRITDLLESDDIPDPRDVMIIALADSCGLLERVFPANELHAARARIDQIVRLDLIGRSVGSVIDSLQSSVISMLGYASIR